MKALYHIIVLVSFISITIGCARLDEPQPQNSIDSEFAIVDESSANAAMNGVYSQMQNDQLSFDGWLALPQFFSDETVFTGTFPTRLEFGNFNIFPSNATMATVFTEFYNLINRANNIITIVPIVEDETFSETARNDFVAQARFVRAHTYLHLVNLWSEVPLVLEPTKATDVGDVLNVNKSSESDIYALIIDDFTFAKNNLVVTDGPNVASVQAANAFLARVALYQENWDEALSFAETALDGLNVSTMNFLEDQIYSLSFSATDGNSIAFFYGPASLGARHSIEPSPKLIAAYSNDSRLELTIDLNSATVPFGIKYPSFAAANAGAATDPIYFIRHAEMSLIAAEAASEMDDFELATTYLNQTRTRAGLPFITLTEDNFVEEILDERFKEFAFEGAFRLIDLRRKGLAEEVLGPLGYDNCDDLWPLPQREIDRNLNLNQNSCCNC